MEILQTETDIQVRGERLVLSGEKAVWWPAKKWLLIADPHLGKSSHFRKKGIAVPGEILVHDLDRLERLIAQFAPGEVIFLGDLFHSEDNSDIDYFKSWRAQFSSTDFQLVKGNHDILEEKRYGELGLRLHHESLTIPPFILKHHPAREGHPRHYIIAGHIHPGVRLKGKGKQSMRLPCFYFGEGQAILPAFGGFTGLATVKPNSRDRIFAVADGQVLNLAGSCG